MYEFIITLKNDETSPSIITIERKFEKEWDAQTELTNIGKNGLIHTNTDGKRIYYPPHRIVEIELNNIIS